MPAGIVLAGGRSSRMGTPKAWLDWHGAPLLTRVCESVARGVGGGPVVVVRAAGQSLPDGEFRVVEDASPGRGPLQGILAGLEAVDDEVAFVASVDLPFLEPRFVAAVCDSIGDADVALPIVDGHRQPLAAAYRTRLVPVVASLLDEVDGAGPPDLFSRCSVRLLDELPFDGSVRGVNTQAELSAALIESDRLLAERLVRVAGEIAVGLRGGPMGMKGHATDVVTEADVRAEAAMVELLRRERPADGVVGEEGAAVEGGSRRWLLDPVDGTLNYARGLSAWCSAACVVDLSGALAAAVFDPVGGEMFSAVRGAGAAAPAEAPSLTEAVVASFVDVRRRDSEVVAGSERLLRRIGALRAVGCGSLELAWVAEGRLDAWVQADVEPWDWHPGALLVSESGGCVRVAGRWFVAARSAALADEILACVRG